MAISATNSNEKATASFSSYRDPTRDSDAVLDDDDPSTHSPVEAAHPPSKQALHYRPPDTKHLSQW